jgi:hypothetical protein
MSRGIGLVQVVGGVRRVEATHGTQLERDWMDGLLQCVEPA